MDVAATGSCFRKVRLGNKRVCIYFSALVATLELPGNTARGIIHVLCDPAQKKYLDRDHPAWADESWTADSYFKRSNRIVIKNKSGFYKESHLMTPYQNDIIDRLKKDDPNALRYLFDMYYKDLVLFSIKFVINKETAEEIVQDVFIRIWNNRNHIIIGKSFEAYLFTSVKNGSINYIKSKYASIRFARLDDSVNLPVNETAEDYINTVELKKAIHQAIHSLPHKCKIIFNLSRNAGLSNREIAEQLNISGKTVQAQIGIATQKIREYLKNQWDNIPS